MYFDSHIEERENRTWSATEPLKYRALTSSYLSIVTTPLSVTVWPQFAMTQCQRDGQADNSTVANTGLCMASSADTLYSLGQNKGRIRSHFSGQKRLRKIASNRIRIATTVNISDFIICSVLCYSNGVSKFIISIAAVA